MHCAVVADSNGTVCDGQTYRQTTAYTVLAKRHAVKALIRVRARAVHTTRGSACSCERFLRQYRVARCIDSSLRNPSSVISLISRGKGGNVTSAGWQVTLCDPIWHVSSRSGVGCLQTAILLTFTCTQFFTASYSVCLCVYLTALQEPHIRTSPNIPCLLPMTVARSLSDGVLVLCHVFPVSWMTSFSHNGPYGAA